MNQKIHQEVLLFSPSGEGKSVLDAILKFKGVKYIAGPMHTDGPEDFEQAAFAAHDIHECLPNLHDTILEATGKSLHDEALLQLLDKLPSEITEQINEWGLADTEVREMIYSYICSNSMLVHTLLSSK